VKFNNIGKGIDIQNPNPYNIWITGNSVSDVDSYGISTSGGNNNYILQNVVNRTGLEGIYLSSSSFSQVIGNVIDSTGSNLISIGGSDNQIENNQLYTQESATYSIGIYIHTSTTNLANFIISGNQIFGNVGVKDPSSCAGSAILLSATNTGTMQAVMIDGNELVGGFREYGILVSGSVTHVACNGNSFSSLSVPAITESGQGDFNVFSSNVFVDCLAPLISLSGSHSTAVYNDGFVTENSGNFTIAGTSVVINHGLSVTPTHAPSITMQTGGFGNVWVSNITRTQFTINVAVSGDYNGSWSYP
jgi:parallel beta-helix repeat protein